MVGMQEVRVTQKPAIDRDQGEPPGMAPHGGWDRPFSGALVARLVAVAAVALVCSYIASFVLNVTNVGFAEDGMILARAMKHFSEGGVLAYNRGEPLSGVSGVGAALLLAPVTLILTKLNGNTFDLSYLAMSYVSLVFFCGFLFLHIGASITIFGATTLLFWILTNGYLVWFGLGLEHIPILLFYVIGALVVTQWRSVPGMFLLGLLCGIRPELLVVALCASSLLFFMSLMPWGSEWQGPTTRLHLALFGGAATFIAAYFLLTGSVLPQTVAAKSFFRPQSVFQPLFEEGVGFLVRRSVEIWKDCTQRAVAPALDYFVLSFAFLSSVLFACSMLLSRKVRETYGLLTIYPSLLLLGYHAFLVFASGWSWYTANYVLLVGLIAITNLLIITRVFPSIASVRARVTTEVAIIVACLGLYVAYQPVWSTSARNTYSWMRNWVKADEAFRGSVSRWLRDRASETGAKTVWMEAAGWQGFFHSLRVLDEVGLTSKATLSFARSAGCDYFVSALKHFQPDLIVKRQLELDKNAMLVPNRNCPAMPLFSSDEDRRWFSEHYHSVWVFDAPDPEWFGPLGRLVVFERTTDPSHSDATSPESTPSAQPRR
jgi:hypothetical protein